VLVSVSVYVCVFSSFLSEGLTYESNSVVFESEGGCAYGCDSVCVLCVCFVCLRLCLCLCLCVHV